MALQPAEAHSFYAVRFTNFASYNILWRDGNTHPTAEHLFQVHKLMTRTDLRNLPNPRAALEEAGRLRRLQRTDWFDVNISGMDAILEAKLAQHPELRDMQLDTGESNLIEDSPVSSSWGSGCDQGRNELGKALLQHLCFWSVFDYL
ncbi:uncharacterized protein B0H18DRAFT_1116037 [Fomitopsis serialis]|uniref:uncharacterized protein n=1 Tax=Fomitopsis serialis TaxID=139415 RepID=UPI00200756E5|nr:uncharacterized protein B0H18DRAFT_1116037 [Neoantrodia serialis]KAH9932386.1 hypothetical protein B0H18DRAFT_1116037 [Neoantrodia serialis]